MTAAAEQNGGAQYGIVEAWTERLVGNRIECEALSPKGLGVFATVEGSLWMLNIWEQPRPHVIEAASLPGVVTSALAFSADGNVLASGCYDGDFYLWDVKADTKALTKKSCFPLGEDNAIRSIVGCPDDKFFASFAGSHISIVGHSGHAFKRITLSGPGNHPVWLKCGTLTCTVDKNTCYWSYPTSADSKHSRERVLHKSGTRVTATAASNTNNLALGFEDGSIIIYPEAEVEGKHGLGEVREEDRKLSPLPGKVINLVWDASSRYLIASGGGKMTIWDVHHGSDGLPSPVPCELSCSDVCKIVVHKKLPLVAALTADGLSFFHLTQKTPLMGPCPATLRSKGDSDGGHEKALGLLTWHQSGLIIATSDNGAVTGWKVAGKVANFLNKNQEQQAANKGPMMPAQQAASSPLNGNGGSSSAPYGTATPVEGSPNSSPDTTKDAVGNGAAAANKGKPRSTAEEAPHTPEASPAGRPSRPSRTGDEATEGDGEAPPEGPPPPPPPHTKDSGASSSGTAIKKPPPLVAPVPSEGDAISRTSIDDLEGSPADIQNTTASTTPMSTVSTAGSSSAATAASGSVASSGGPSNVPVHLQPQQQMTHQQPQQQQGGRVYGGRPRGPGPAQGGMNNGSRGHQGGPGPRSRRSQDGHRDRDQHHGGGGWGGNAYHQGNQGNGMAMGPYGGHGYAAAPPIPPVMPPGAVPMMQGIAQMTPQQLQWYSQQLQQQMQAQAHYMQNFFAAQHAAAAGAGAAGGGNPYGAGANAHMYGGHPAHMAPMRGGAGAGGMMMPQEHDPEAYQRHMMMMMQQEGPQQQQQQVTDHQGILHVATLYVGNLAESVTDALLSQAFRVFGTVTGSQIIKDKITHTSRGFGFVTFENPVVATFAMNSMQGVVLGGPFEQRTLRVAASNRAQRWGWGSA